MLVLSPSLFSIGYVNSPDALHGLAPWNGDGPAKTFRNQVLLRYEHVQAQKNPPNFHCQLLESALGLDKPHFDHAFTRLTEPYPNKNVELGHKILSLHSNGKRYKGNPKKVQGTHFER